MIPTRTRTTGALVAAFTTALVLGSCTGDAETPPEPNDTTRTDPGPTGEPDPPTDGEPDDDPDDGSGGGPGPGTEPVDQADLPGAPIDLFAAEDTLDVVGVAHDDVLYVRELPDPGAAEVTALAPMTQDVEITGRAQQIDNGPIWLELQVQDRVGWSSLAYLAYLGLVVDETDQITDPGPQASMDDLAATIVNQLMPAEDGPQPETTVVQEPDGNDLVTMMLDVQGLADDSINGYRLHIVAGTDAAGEYVLDYVESTQICLRGTSDQGCL